MGSSSWELMRYAMEQRNYLALLGLILQQRWLRHSFTQLARLAGFGVAIVGISLVIFVTVVLARDAVPAFATPGTAFNKFLMFLLVTISYNILHNYVCATTFSLRLGSGPLQDSERGAALSTPGRGERFDDGSESTPSSTDADNSSDSEDELAAAALAATEEGAEEEVRVPLSARPSASGCGGAVRAAAATTTARTRQGSRGAPGASNAASSASSSKEVVHTRPWHRDGPRTGTEGLSTSRKAPSPGCCPSSRLLARLGKGLARGVGRCVNGSTDPTADPDVLAEIEAVTAELEAYTPTERRYKLLDPARRYCRHCRRLKAPREHHCAVCNRCVAKMDHHCPFIRSCVDAENVRYFVLVVFWLWVGTFCVNVFIGYGYGRQWWYESRWARAKTVGERATLVSPYGPNGRKLTGFAVTLSLTLTGVMFIAMSVFVYTLRAQVLENTTAIEQAVVEDKQERVFGSTSFIYRTPYNLGGWRNVLECFRTLDDPLVKADLRRGEDVAAAAAGDGRERGSVSASNAAMAEVLATLLPPARSHAESQARTVAWRFTVLLWLVAVPTLRPTGCDGVHYPLYDTETRDLDGYCIAGARRRQGQT